MIVNIMLTLVTISVPLVLAFIYLVDGDCDFHNQHNLTKAVAWSILACFIGIDLSIIAQVWS